MAKKIKCVIIIENDIDNLNNQEINTNIKGKINKDMLIQLIILCSAKLNEMIKKDND